MGNAGDSWTADEVRRELGISEATYFRWLRAGRLRGVRAGRRWRFPRAAVEGLLRSGGASAHEVRRALESAAVEARRRIMNQGCSVKEVDAMEKNATPAARLARLVLEHAHRSRADALHLDPVADGLCIRERVEGTLAPVGAPCPAAAAPELAAALRAMVGLGPVPPDRPAEGRGFAKIGGRRVELLVASLPTSLGESLTVRLLDPERAIPPLDRLGLRRDQVRTLRQWMARPSGVIVVSGPTGSGKTTTLYSMLREARRPDRKIMTAEDPVEVTLDGVQQTPVSGPGGAGFCEALRAMLRHDPDLLMVGEIRDAETARLVFAAAASGRRVLTALHASRGLDAIRRLVALNAAPPALIAETLIGVLTQRLVGAGRRRLVAEVLTVTPPLRRAMETGRFADGAARSSAVTRRS